MKKSMAKVLAGALSLAMAVTLVTPSNAAAASKPKFSKTYSNVYSGTSAAYTVKNVKKGYTVKVSVTGTAKKAVKLSKSKINVTKTTAKFTAKVTASASTANKGATVTAVVYDKKGKKVKTLKDGIRIKAHATAVAVSAADTKAAIGQAVALTTTLTPTYATDAVSYTVDPADGATVENGQFTATKEGTYKVTATVNGRTSEPVEIVVTNGIVSATQTASNSFKATFAADASKTVSTGSITVKANDATKTELQVKEIKFSADGKEAEVTLLNNLTDKTAYTVTANGASAEFTASIGAVAKIQIDTASAEVNEATAVEFKLLDANGIDVTSVSKVDEKCYVTAEGDYTNVDFNVPSKAKITFGEVGKKATVKVVYNSGDKDAVDVIGTQEITCTSASAKTGDMLFAKTNKINDKSQCAKFYLGLSDKEVSVKVGETPDNIFFCAKDSSGKVISYDSYEVESSNDNVASASLSVDSGKFARIAVSGSEKGSATLKITATKNGAASYYTIPVTVKAAGAAVKMDCSQSLSKMSNADDELYFDKIEAKLKDADGNNVDGTYTYKVTNNPKGYDGEGEATANVDNALVVEQTNGVFEVYAYNVKTSKDFTVQITGSDNQSDKTFTRNITVSVKTLPTTGKPVVTYSVEVDHKSLDVNPDKGDKTANVRLKATINSLFAGYVGSDKKSAAEDNAITKGLLVDKAGTADDVALVDKYIIDDAKAYVTYGTNQYDEASGLVRPATGSAVKADLRNTDPTATYQAVKATGSSIVYAYSVSGLTKGSDAYNNAGFAMNGNYVAKIDISVADTNVKDTTLQASFSVANTTVQPTVSVSTSKVTSLSPETVREEALTTNVDMNNNDSEFASITSVLYGMKYAPVTESNSKLTIKYVEVTDLYGSYTYHFMVPVSRTFTLK